MIRRVSHALLRAIAFYVLEPRFRKGGKMRATTIERLKPALKELNEVYEEARKFFDDVGMCRVCAADCCMGEFSRFTVYDHISHVVAGVKEPPAWGYRLHPLSSFERNRVAGGWCPAFVKGKGCGVVHSLRPAMCIWWICANMERRLDPDQRAIVRRIRQRIDKVHWKYAWVLVPSGLDLEKS